MPMVPRKRGVSRSRYERMLQEAMLEVNVAIYKKNKDLVPSLRQTPVTYREMLGSSRRKAVSHARFRIFRELHDMGFSYPSIAKVAGLDHTSCLHGVRRINELEPLPVLVAEVGKWATVNTSSGDSISVAQGTQRTTYLDEALTLLEIPMVAISH